MKHPIYNSKWIIGNIWLNSNKGQNNNLILRAMKAGFREDEFKIPVNYPTAKQV